jgi:hypothetical protein
MSEENNNPYFSNEYDLQKSLFGQHALPHIQNNVKTDADEAAAEKVLQYEQYIVQAGQVQADHDAKTRQAMYENDAATTKDTRDKIENIDLVDRIFNKICFKNGIIPNIILWKTGDHRDNGNTQYSMLNINNQNGSLEFQKKIDEILLNNNITQHTQMASYKMYNNFIEFLKKMNVRLVVKDINAYCQIELHDTIGLFTLSESKGDRCNALNKFVNVIGQIVKYINSNSGSGRLLKNGNIEHVNSSMSNTLFNFPAKFENIGSGFKESYKACNSGTTLSIGGSKSRRTRRRKHNRKTHHKQARKTHHKRAPKSHKRKRHSRAARKHKKHTSRR